jgi:hypothetical protein
MLIVGRLILQFVPDPVAALRSLSTLIRPGGVLAFQEISYAPYLALSAHLPLWFAVASVIHETFRQSGAKTEIGIDLFHLFQGSSHHGYNWLPTSVGTTPRVVVRESGVSVVAVK